MAENVPTSKFNERFKAQLEGLLESPQENTASLHRLLNEMVECVAGNITFPAFSREDIEQEVRMWAIELLPKVAQIQSRNENPTTYYRVCINRKFWELTTRETLRRKSEQTLAISSHFGGVNHLTKANEAKKARATPRDVVAFLQRSRRFIDNGIDKLLDSFADADGEVARAKLDGQLRGIQEMRRHFMKRYKPCETPMTRYTVERAIPKGE